MLIVGETNNCGYCVAAHTALGKGAGLTGSETSDARHDLGDLALIVSGLPDALNIFVGNPATLVDIRATSYDTLSF